MPPSFLTSPNNKAFPSRYVLEIPLALVFLHAFPFTAALGSRITQWFAAYVTASHRV